MGGRASRKSGNFRKGSLDPQAIEQLTISGSSRQGQPEHGNHLRLRALAWDDVQAQVEKYLSTIHHQQSAQLVDISGVDRRKVAELRELDRSAKGLLVQRRNLKKGTEKRRHLEAISRSASAQACRSPSPKGKFVFDVN